jgi:hypothetical protein
MHAMKKREIERYKFRSQRRSRFVLFWIGHSAVWWAVPILSDEHATSFLRQKSFIHQLLGIHGIIIQKAQQLGH